MSKRSPTFNDILEMFYADKLTSNYLYCNLKDEVRKNFLYRCCDHPNKYLVGRKLTKTQMQLLKKSFCLVRCKREDCEYYHSKFYPCNECAIVNNKNKFIKNKKNTCDKLECVICISTIKKGETYTFLSCEHSFHTECISAWFKMHLNCPCCRKDFHNV